MAASAGTPDLKRKPISHHVDRIPRDGLTGMGPMTQIHFVGVRRKMMEFVQQQEMVEVDGFPLHHGGPPPPSRHHHHHHHHHHAPRPVFVDQKKPPSKRNHPSGSPVHKHGPSVPVGSPQMARRVNKPSSSSNEVKPSPRGSLF